MNSNAPSSLEAARDAFEDEQPPLRDGIYRWGSSEYCAIVEDGDGWIVVPEDGVGLRFTRKAMPVLRRCDRLPREHKLAANLARVIGTRSGKQLVAFAREQLRDILDEAEL